MTVLKEEILKYILAAFPLARKRAITFEDSLLEGGIIDSLGVLEVVNYLSEQLKIQVEEEDLTPENFQTINAIAHLVEHKRNIG